MKRTICLILAVLMLMMSGCNYTLVGTEWNFKYAYITLNGEVKEVEVRKWTPGETNVTITDTEGVTYLTDYKNVVLTTKRWK